MQNSINQFEPFRPPSNWNTEERRLIVQITEAIEDIHQRLALISPAANQEITNKLTELGIAIQGLAARIEMLEASIF